MACKNQEELSLFWENFNTNLSSGIYDFLYGGDLVDVTLAAEGQQIKVHRLVLSLCSPYFRQMFTQTPPDQDEIVSLSNISFATLKNLIQFMYCGEVSLSQDDLPDFLSAAELLQIKGLSENEPLKQAVTTEPQRTKGAHKTDIDRNKAIIFVHPTRKRIREESSAEQIAPKRMKVLDSMEAHSYSNQSKSFDELKVLVPSNEHSQMSDNAEFSYADDEIGFDFDDESANTTADEKGPIIHMPDDQLLNYDLNYENWDHQESADNNNLFGGQIAIKSPEVDLIKCPYCVYKSKKNSHVISHIRTQHTHKDEKPFKCGKCSYAAKRNHDLNRHLKTCKG